MLLAFFNPRSNIKLANHHRLARLVTATPILVSLVFAIVVIIIVIVVVPSPRAVVPPASVTVIVRIISTSAAV